MISTSLTLIVLAFAAVDVDVTTLDGGTSTGQLVSLDSDSLVVAVDGDERTIATASLMGVAPQSAPNALAIEPSMVVTLVGGTRLAAKSYVTTRGEATLELTNETKIDVRTRDVDTVVFNQQDDRIAAQWQAITQDDVRGDVVVLRKEGRGDDSRAFLDYIDGVLLDVTADAFSFSLEGEKKTIPFSRVDLEGFIYFHARSRDLPGVICRVIDNGGNVWQAQQLKLAGQQVELLTVSGVEAKVDFASVQRFDFSSGKIVFLSDLKPIKQTWQPFLPASSTSDAAERLFGYRRDESLDGKPITLAGRTFAKGLAVPSRTELIYRLPGEFSKFEVTLGMEADQKIQGHVICQIFGDDRELYTGEFSGDDEPRTLTLDTSGVGRLRILVDFGRGFDIGDQLLMGNARVVK